MLQVLCVLLAWFYMFMVANTMIFGETYQSDEINPTFGDNPPRPYLEAFFMQFQLLTGEGAQDVKNAAVFTDSWAKAVVQHGMFIGFNFAVSIIMIDLVVATFLEYRGISRRRRRRRHQHNNNDADGDERLRSA